MLTVTYKPWPSDFFFLIYLEEWFERKHEYLSSAKIATVHFCALERSVVPDSNVDCTLFTHKSIHKSCLHQVRPGLIALSQQILGPNTLIQGALPEILANTPQSFFENSMNVIQVSGNKMDGYLILTIISTIKLQTWCIEERP